VAYFKGQTALACVTPKVARTEPDIAPAGSGRIPEHLSKEDTAD